MCTDTVLTGTDIDPQVLCWFNFNKLGGILPVIDFFVLS